MGRIWVFRAGKNGEHEKKFLEESRIYLSWYGLKEDMSKMDYGGVKEYVRQLFPELSGDYLNRRILQIYPFVHSMQDGDWVILPSKFDRTLHFGKIVGDYQYEFIGPAPYYHYRNVDWFEKDVPVDIFDSEIIYATQVHSTIFRITDERIVSIIEQTANNGWNQPHIPPLEFIGSELNIDDAAVASIKKYVYQKFKGYAMEDLICEILRAKGFTVYNGPKGPDGGQDLLAAAGDMGFESPRICVQVKTQNQVVEKSVVDKLEDTIKKFKAEYGLFVAWNGYEKAVDPAEYFYSIRLWTSKEVIEELLANYEKISPEMQQRIPLRHIWILNDLGDETD